ncbi:CaiB/BaiF CoA transferase family protein [Pseudoroseomonas globiformis]|uniref:CaiB/BaiF CoA transferase family protein n=1 Tax=Teichococcus globiformis TaxID=2307229 RepID=A0ABV7G105_9PROT
MPTKQSKSRPPLMTGIRVLDLSRLVAGNVLSAALADLGAEVIKVETPRGGDELRAWRTDGVSTHWKAYARGKKSLAIDLRTTSGKDILLRLIGRSDALVENFRPGTLEKMGLGPDVLHAVNPRLILARISGWGQSGPWRHRPGFGSLVEGLSGFAAMNGFADREPVLPPFPLADSVTGLYGALGIVAALRQVEATGAGRILDLSLFDGVFSVLGPLALDHQVSGRVPLRQGSRAPSHAPRNVYRTADNRWVALSAGMQVSVERLFSALGRPELSRDSRFSTPAARQANVDALDDLIAAAIATRDLEANLALFEEADVTAGAVLDATQLVGHPYLRERGALVEVPDAELGSALVHAPAIRFEDGSPSPISGPAPALGEHSREILRDLLGLSEEEVQELLDAGVISTPAAATNGTNAA